MDAMTDEFMTGETLMRSLRNIIAKLEVENADLEAEGDDLRRRIEEQEAEIGALNRHNIELRGAIDALLQPAPSELLAKNIAHPSRQNLDKVEHDGT